MASGSLTLDELERFRKVSQLQNENKQRVAELCERGMQESREKQLEATRATFDKLQQAKSTGAPQGQGQQPQTTSAMLGSLQPLQPAKPSPQKTVKTAPDPSRIKTATMPPPPVVIKTFPLPIGQKGTKPLGPPPKAPPVKQLPTSFSKDNNCEDPRI